MPELAIGDRVLMQSRWHFANNNMFLYRVRARWDFALTRFNSARIDRDSEVLLAVV